MKKAFMRWWSLSFQLEALLRLGGRIGRSNVLGKGASLLIDRFIFHCFGLDVSTRTIAVRRLSIAHPNGVLLGGNGIMSDGRVAIMAGVKFVGRSPNDSRYLERHKTQSVFKFGDNVVIGANSVVVGPVSICDDVIVATMSLVNKDILVPGVYGGIPATLLKAEVDDEWVRHLGPKRAV